MFKDVQPQMKNIVQIKNYGCKNKYFIIQIIKWLIETDIAP